jgi:hypothetical protein
MNEFLNYIIKEGMFKKIKFFKSMFAKTENEYIKKTKSGYEVTVNGKTFELKADTKKALLHQNVEFTLNGAFVGVNKDIKTTIGIAVNNYLFFEYALEGMFDVYINDEFVYEYIEDKYVLPNKEKVGLRRFKKCGVTCLYLREMADVFVISGTLKTAAKPKWLDAFKKETVKKLEKKYGKGAMKDKHVFLEYEQIVMDKYHDYLKDDPTYMITTDNKIIGSSLRKKYVSVGILDTVDPDQRTGIITSSLKDGLPKDKKDFAVIVNNLINGSYERGISTKDSGYLSKIIVRVMFPYKIIKDSDCGTKLGCVLPVTKKNAKSLIGMSYLQSGKTIKITKDNVVGLIGKSISLRTQHNCKSKGSTFCSVCSGDELARTEYSVVLLASETGGMALKHNLSKFHVTNYKLIDIDIDDLIY